MYDYKSIYNEMKISYNRNQSSLSNENLKIEHYNFHSSHELTLNSTQLTQGDLYFHELVDRKITENNEFSYPIIYPTSTKQFSKGILLLHGLNEKSWEKYLAWAKTLAEELKRPVILFPIAYHMNRAPKSWSNPRIMSGIVKSRKDKQPKGETTFANAALSTRLGANPEQFIYSGIQSYYDVWNLLKQINSGEHTLFESRTTIDVFAYSIGAFLAEILFLNNPGELLSSSRLFLFAGGPTFDHMMGTSRYIMDITAFKSLLQLRHKKRLRKIHDTLATANYFEFEKTWDGFYAMMHLRKGRKTRKKRWSKMGNNVYAVVLEKDRVMPVKTIIRTLKGKRHKLPVRVDVIDFPYSYTHENPFPINDEKIEALVNRCFTIVFEKAIRFFAQDEA